MYIQQSRLWPRDGQFANDFNRAVSRLFDGTEGDASDVATSEWAPRVDICEEDQRFVIAADIPGVDPKDIDVHMDKGVLSIRGERKAAVAADDGKYTRVERAHGAFHRRFALPDSADAAGVRASGKFGVLEIVIPKRPETTPRKIEIQTAA